MKDQRAIPLALLLVLALAFSAAVAEARTLPRACSDAIRVMRQVKPDLDKAIQLYGRCLQQRMSPEDKANMYLKRGNARFRKDDHQNAIADYTASIGLYPSPEAYYNRAGAKKGDGDLQGAIGDFSEAIRLRPDYAKAYHHRGRAKRDLEDFTGAIADFDEAIRINPNDTDAYRRRGLAKRNAGDIPGALADLDEAIRLEPEYMQAYASRGMVKRKSGDFSGAIADYTEAIRLDPEYPDTYGYRGYARQQSGEVAGAVADYTKVIELAPDEAESYNNLAWIYATWPDAKWRDSEKALELAKKAVALEPTHYKIDTLAAAYARAGRFAEAEKTQSEALAKLKETNPTPEVLADYQSRLDLYKQHKAYTRPK